MLCGTGCDEIPQPTGDLKIESVSSLLHREVTADRRLGWSRPKFAHKAAMSCNVYNYCSTLSFAGVELS